LLLDGNKSSSFGAKLLNGAGLLTCFRKLLSARPAPSCKASLAPFCNGDTDVIGEDIATSLEPTFFFRPMTSTNSS